MAAAEAWQATRTLPQLGLRLSGIDACDGCEAVSAYETSS